METSEPNAQAVWLRTEEFVLALRATPMVERFVEAQRRFDSDPEVQTLLEGFERQAEAFRQGQQANSVGAAQVREMRDAQARVQAHPIVREFIEAREAVGTFLQETNLAISETLGVDFGQTAGPAGGAC